MKTQILKLPGKKSGYAAKIFLRGVHVATVADPDSNTGSRDAAAVAANKWAIEWKDLLFPDGGRTS
jgi:hypothetical protein